MNYADMMVITSNFFRKTEEVIKRLNLEETIQHITRQNEIKKILEEGFESCLESLKKIALFSREDQKESAEKNVKSFESQKENFMSDFLTNFKIVLGINPIVFLSENVRDDDVIRKIVMKMLNTPKVYEIAHRTFEYQINGIIHKSIVATIMDNKPENMTVELSHEINLVSSQNDTLMLPTSIGFI